MADISVSAGLLKTENESIFFEGGGYLKKQQRSCQTADLCKEHIMSPRRCR